MADKLSLNKLRNNEEVDETLYMYTLPRKRFSNSLCKSFFDVKNYLTDCIELFNEEAVSTTETTDRRMK
jgi:hypothetical protein